MCKTRPAKTQSKTEIETVTLEKRSVLNCGLTVELQHLNQIHYPNYIGCTAAVMQPTATWLQKWKQKTNRFFIFFSYNPEHLTMLRNSPKRYQHFLQAAPPERLFWHPVWKCQEGFEPRKKMAVLPPLPDSCMQFYVPLFNAIMVTAARGTCSTARSVPPASRYMIYILTLTANLWKESTNSFPNFSAVQTWSIPLCRAPEEADSWSSSQWDICISGLFFILSIFHSQRRGTLMSLKSHYGCCSEPAKADFLWFCSGAEEMREAKSPWSKIQKDMAGHEGCAFL